MEQNSGICILFTQKFGISTAIIIRVEVIYVVAILK